MKWSRWIFSLERDKTDIPKTYIEEDPKLHDFYTTRDVYKASQLDKKEYDDLINSLSQEQKDWLGGGKNIYNVTVEKVGGLIMPVILKMEYADGTEDLHRIPAEIWIGVDTEFTKVFITDKEVVQMSLDPYWETADVDVDNNYWPPKQMPSRFDMFKKQKQANRQGENPMQRDRREK